MSTQLHDDLPKCLSQGEKTTQEFPKSLTIDQDVFWGRRGKKMGNDFSRGFFSWHQEHTSRDNRYG
jgi:hypothetical protein